MEFTRQSNICFKKTNLTQTMCLRIDFDSVKIDLETNWKNQFSKLEIDTELQRNTKMMTQ